MSSPLRAAFLIVAASLIALPLAAQTSVRGIVTDSAEVGLPGATVVLLQRADSSIVSFGTSGSDGRFEIPRAPRGAFLLQVTYVGFLPSTTPIEIASGPIDVGRIQLAEDLEGLDPLVVTADRVPLVIRRDTLDFDADAFGTPQGASVEDLLRRIPGVQVDRDGSIQAQGEDVERVLVDGKEFFGDDPTIATRNLPADAVDRVQIYDQASDIAEFTGIEDGNESRTINLALKEDRRTGVFGSVRGGAGGSTPAPGSGLADGLRFDGSASVNRFNPSTQLSFIGNANNVNRQDFGIEDYIQFMGGLSALASGGGSIQLQPSSLGFPIGDQADGGFATTFSGGVNLNRDFGSATTLESSYFGSEIGTERARDVRRQQLLGDGLASSTTEDALATSQAGAHRLNTTLEHEIEKGHDLRLRTNLRTIGSDVTSQNLRETIGPSGLLDADRRTNSETGARSIGGNTSLTYRRRLPQGRSLVAQTQAGFESDSEDRDLVSTDPITQDLDEEIDQAQERDDRTTSVSAQALLTQPVGTRRALQADVQHSVAWDRQDRGVADRVGSDVIPNPALSSALDRTVHVTRGGLTYRDSGPRHVASLGVHLEQTWLDGRVRDLDAFVDRRALRLLPSASLTYTFPRDQRLTLRYQAQTSQPTLGQLQPVANNSNPLNVYVGNPDLRAETRHTLSARFFHFDTFSLTNTSVAVRATYTPTAISTDRTIDDRFRQRRTPINYGSSWRVTGNAAYGTPIRSVRTKVTASATAVYQRQTERVNGEDNASDIVRATLDLGIENQRKVWLDVRAGARVAYNRSTYSLSPEFDRSYVRRTFYAEGSAELGSSWFLGTALDLEWVPEDVFGASRQLPLWSAEVSRSVGAQTRLQLVANDLLDQGLRVRYADAGAFIQEERVQTLGRHVLLKLIVDLSGVRR
ncbi:MAG: outer membrane beta-barrel protein [Bacteroidota bacterium]